MSAPLERGQPPSTTTKTFSSKDSSQIPMTVNRKGKEFHLFQLVSKETPVITMRRWLCSPSHSSIPPSTSLPSVAKFTCTCGHVSSPRPSRGSSNSRGLSKFYNIYLAGIKVNKSTSLRGRVSLPLSVPGFGVSLFTRRC